MVKTYRLDTLPIGVGCKHLMTVRSGLLITMSLRWVCALRRQIGEKYSAFELT